MVKVIASTFEGRHRPGDFGWMLSQDEYANAFFVFNDNESQFLAHEKDPTAPGGCSAGGGNAAIRPYQCETPPRAGGVPTGDFNIAGGPGYPALTDEVKAIIDRAVASIAKAVAENGYDTIYYSGDGQGGLGHGIFDPAEDVKAYIVTSLEGLATPSSN